MIRVVVDWETAYGKHPVTRENITLSSMTTEEYVRHPKFKVHGLGVKIDKDPAFYIYKKDDLVYFLRSHPWNQSYVVAHHTHFDGAIFSWRLGIRPLLWGCTLSMARAIYPYESSSLANIAKVIGVGEKGTELMRFVNKWVLTNEEQEVLGGYCINDVNLTALVFDTLKKHFPVSELRLVDWTIRAFTEPTIQIDPAPLVRAYATTKRTKRALIKQCVTDKESLASNDKFAELLVTLGVDPPKKISPTKIKDGRVNPDSIGEPPIGLLKPITGKLPAEEKKVYPWSYAFGKTDEKFMLLKDHPDLKVQAVVEARLGVKSTITETRTKRYYKIGKRGAFPVYLNYYGAHTNRWSGGDKQNAQNMNRVDPNDPESGALRKSWVAPEGHVFVVRDLGQIEARMLVYWAGQENMLEVFRSGGDPYCYAASDTYGRVITKADKKERGVGKIIILGCGYGMGWAALQESVRVGFMGMPGILFDQGYVDQLGADIDWFAQQRSYKPGCTTCEDQALSTKPLNLTEEEHIKHCAVTKFIIDSYRNKNKEVVKLWKEANNALSLMIAGISSPVGTRPLVSTTRGGFLLPNNMLIRYNKLRKSSSGDFKYLANTKKKEWIKLYGGKCVENCISEGTKVYTNKGWIAIEDITSSHKVFDGVDFVFHGGILTKGTQNCITLDGVLLTPDHKVLTNEKTWAPACSVAPSGEKLFRPNFWDIDSIIPSSFRWKKTFLGFSLSVWEAGDKNRRIRGEGNKKRRNPQLWVYNKAVNVEGLSSTWNVKTPSFRSMAGYARQVSFAFASGMEKLWREGYTRMRSVAEVFCQFLGRYGAYVYSGFEFGSNRQRRSIFPVELPVGIYESSRAKPEKKRIYKYPKRTDDNIRSIRGVQHRGDNNYLPNAAQLAGRQTTYCPQLHQPRRVIDIINCGPRNRFVILGDSGPFIVHNCTQALSRLVLSDQLLRVNNRLKGTPLRSGEILRTVSTTHDEIISLAPERLAEQCLDIMKEEMAMPSAWCRDLPLKSSGGFSQSYGDVDK